MLSKEDNMIRPVVQVVRFYIINKGVTSRSIESLMDNPSYNPLLKHCVNTIKRYPDWAIATCKEHMKEVDQKRFKFNSGAWAMDIREEDIPKGTVIDWLTLHQAFSDIITWINKNRAVFTQQIAREEARRQ
jgi:hypothetical protein